MGFETDSTYIIKQKKSTLLRKSVELKVRNILGARIVQRFTA